LSGCTNYLSINKKIPDWADTYLTDTRFIQNISKSVVIIKNSESINPNSALCSSDIFSNGVIISEDGMILTVCHALSGKKPLVILNDGKKVYADILFRNKQTDMAILKISSEKPLPFTPIENRCINQGDSVYVVGKRGSSCMVLTSKGKVLFHGINLFIKDLIIEAGVVHSSNIEPGLSGSPLISVNGKVIGINAMFFGNEGDGKSASLNICKFESLIRDHKFSYNHTAFVDTATTPEFAGLSEELLWILEGLENYRKKNEKTQMNIQDLKHSILKQALDHYKNGIFKSKSEVYSWIWKTFLSNC